MITEDYVSFETAKLLNEKGFDAKCRYVWKFDKANDHQDTDGISKICAERFMEGESSVDNSDIKKVAEYEDWFEDYNKAYLCPTLQMAMKWLREVYKECIVVQPVVTDDDGSAGCLWSFSISKSLELQYKSESVYELYAVSCESAIKYCLENLI